VCDWVLPEEAPAPPAGWNRFHRSQGTGRTVSVVGRPCDVAQEEAIIVRVLWQLMRNGGHRGKPDAGAHRGGAAAKMVATGAKA